MDLMRWIKFQWDRAAALILFVVGILALVLGYIGTARSAYPAEQLPYMISGGVVGIFLLGTAGVLYLSADMRDEWRKLDSLDLSVRELVLRTPPLSDAQSSNPEVPATPDVDSDLEATGAVPIRSVSRAATRTSTRRTTSRRS